MRVSPSQLLTWAGANGWPAKIEAEFHKRGLSSPCDLGKLTFEMWDAEHPVAEEEDTP